MVTGAYLGKKGLIQGHIFGELTDIEFENHKNVLSADSNKLGQKFVEWDTKTQILR